MSSKINVDFKIECDHLEKEELNRFIRLALNANIRGYEISFLAMRLNGGNVDKTTIRGLKSDYVQYASFVGDSVVQRGYQMIGINGVYDFKRFTLDKYIQNLNADWGAFECKCPPSNPKCFNYINFYFTQLKLL